MHKEFMDAYGGYLKKHYTDLDNMSCTQLREARMIAEVMKEIFKADKEYNIVKVMEEHDQSDIDMNWDEFFVRFVKMYEDADAPTKTTMRTEIMKIIS